MTREKLIADLVRSLKALPKDVDVAVNVKYGTARRDMCDGYVDVKPTGGATITFTINGGSDDVELTPEWHLAALQLNRD